MSEKKNKKQKISGWFIYWFGTNNKIPYDEWARIILIDQTRNPNKTKQVLDFVEKYYISTMYLSEKIALASPKARRDYRNMKGKVEEYIKNKNGYIISYGHNPMIIAEYRKNVSMPDKDYPTWFPR